ncbi:MAG: segregation and condensation protein [Chloroflexia bacterium]|jgi:segregation and condensation protein B|nr:segregation and condensation protein [Chloroflexia bacterium]
MPDDTDAAQQPTLTTDQQSALTEREDIQEMAAALEALLFTAPEPVPVSDLRRALQVRQPTLERVVEFLGKSLSEGKRGLRLQRHNDMLRLVTAPETALYIEKLKGAQATQRLSDAALETLALIAYTQPTTRPQIEAIRGVDCSGVVNTLMQRGLVVEVGRLDTVGHPILYGTTLAFLQHFGLERPDQLPSVIGLPFRSGETKEAEGEWAAKDETPTPDRSPGSPGPSTSHPPEGEGP